jgi:hypothetical protein
LLAGTPRRCRWCAVAFLSLDACYSHLNDGHCPVLEEKKRKEAAEAAEAARRTASTIANSSNTGDPTANEDEEDEDEDDEDYENPDDDNSDEEEEEDEEDADEPTSDKALPAAPAGPVSPAVANNQLECPMCAASFGDLFMLENHVIREHNVTSTARVKLLLDGAVNGGSQAHKKNVVKDVQVKKNSHADPMDCYDGSVGMFR